MAPSFLRPLQWCAIALTFAWMPAHAQLEYVRMDYPADDTTQYPNSFVHCARADNGDVIRVFQLGHLSNDHTIRAYRTADDGSLIWAKRIEPLGGINWDVQDIVVLPDGSICIGGHGSAASAFIMRLDVSGTLAMARSFELQGSTWLDAMQVINDSTLRLAGYRVNAGAWSWMATADVDGTVQNAFTLMKGPLGTSLRSTSTYSLADGSTLHIARAQSSMGPLTSGATVCLVDSADSVQWCQSISLPGATTQFDPIGSVMLADGSIRIACSLLSSLDANVYPAVIALSSSGVPQWAVQVDLPGPNHRITPGGVIQLSDTTFAIIGQKANGFLGAFVIMGASGTLLGTVTWPDVSCDLHEAEVLPGGDVLVCGYGIITGMPAPNCTLIRCAPDLELCGASDVLASIVPLAMTLADSSDQVPLICTSTDILPDLLVTDQPLLTVDPCLNTSVQDQEITRGPAIWPNPVMDVLHLQGEGIERIDLFDATGRAMLTRSYPGIARTELDIRAFPAGLYLVRIHSNGERTGVVLVKE